MNGGCHYSVLADTLLEHLVLTVERFEQCLVLASDSLIGIAHHFRSYKRFTVGQALVMLDDLRLNVVQSEVDVPCLLALAFGSVALDVPKRFRNTLLATELRHSPVDCHSSHDGDNTVSFLAAVHVEQHFECTSCHTRFLFAKLLLNELDLDKQIGAERRNHCRER